MDRDIFKDINYGMYIVTSNNEKNVGCIINTLTQITSVDPLISISLNKNNYTNQTIKKVKKFAVSILNEKINPSVISDFGFKSSLEFDKFKNIEYDNISNLPVLKNGICGYLICEVVNIVDCNTHDIFIAKVIDAKKTSIDNAMSYNYYLEVIKGRAPKNAPTFIEQSPNNSTESWECLLCGYVHEGPLPDDFVCPICGATKDSFKKK